MNTTLCSSCPLATTPAHELTFTVTCAGQAGGFEGTVPFALAVSLEVGAGVSVDVYELVETEFRVRQQIR